MTTEQMSSLLEQQPVVAESAIFVGPAFPRIDFLYRELVEAALGSYTLTVRYFDSAWNEVTKAGAAGRYGAWVEIQFANGLTDQRRVTLFKTASGYKPHDDPYRFTIEFPSAFVLPRETVAREQWNVDYLMNWLMGDAARQSDRAAVLAATLHDYTRDPARWHGFNYWHVQEGWWTGLEKKLGRWSDYPRLETLPQGYDDIPLKRWPLLLFLHGTYECGTDLALLRDQGPQGAIARGRALPFIVVSPQCPKGSSWSTEKLRRLLEQVEMLYRVDPQRIYITGLSMGGFSTLQLAASFPEKFAAIAPLSAGETPEIAERLKTVPTWFFHGADDTIVPARHAAAVAERMEALGAEVKLTIQPGVGHEGWNKIYDDPALYDWFLQHVFGVTTSAG